METKPVILLVDDTPELGVIVKVLGRRAGHEVVVCSDVRQGWAFLQERLPDLVLVDLNLPGPSGLKLCKLIRETASLSALPTALFTHWHQPQDVVAALEAHVDFVVDKELTSQPEAWQSRLSEILTWVHGRAQAALISWLEEVEPPTLPANWIEWLNRALRHGCLRRLQPQVLRCLLVRALDQAVSPHVAAAPTSWLDPEQAQLCARLCPANLAVAVVLALVVSLVEQTARVLGREETTEFRTALAPLTPGLEQLLARQ
jgi:CheY-like chemotaxis protein